MKNMIRFEKVDGIIISMSVENFFEDGSFLTRCILSGKNNSYSYKQYGHTPLNLVTPKVSYGIYEKCEDQKDANILQISYYGGTSSENIVDFIEDDVFVIDEKLPVTYRLPNEMEERFGRVNNILNYVGLEHVEKDADKIQFDGDCNTKIKLLPECKYELFKFVSNKEINK